MLAWLALLIAQPTLGTQGNLARHRQLGRIGGVLAVFITGLGIFTGVASLMLNRFPPFFTPPYFLALTYINCSAAVKALRDVIVTSSSAETIISQIPPEQKIIFGPDRHLGGYLNRKFGRDMLLWPGVCIVHEAFSETELLKLKAQHPGAPVAAHPECPPHIVDHADYVGSTSGILQFAKNFPGDTLIVATEPHIIHQMELALPEKNFIGAPGADGNCNCNICPYMALNTMEKLYLALRDLQPRIEMEEGLRLAARKSLDRMLDMASGTVGKGDLGRA